jgi:hypothetical protein
MLEIQPKRTKVTLSIDADALLFLRKVVGQRGMGDKLGELIFDYQHRRQAELRNRRRLAALRRGTVTESEGSIWLYG